MTTEHYKKKNRALINSIMDGFEFTIEKMDVSENKMFSSMCNDFCWYTEQVEVLKKTIEKEGYLIDDKENPNIAILHKMTARKGELFAKIRKVIKEENGKPEISEIESFLDE